MRASTWLLLSMLASLVPSIAALGGMGQQPMSQPSKTINAALRGSHIIPDVLDDFEPSISIILSYPHSHTNVDLGNLLKPEAVSSPPNIYIDVLSFSPTRTLKPNVTYVLALTDPDATSHSDPVKAQMCHWIVANISIPAKFTGNRGNRAPLLSKFDTTLDDDGIFLIESYFPPTPPPRTGYHRYVFVLLQQPAECSKTPTKPKERTHWGYGMIGAGVREWAAENDLEVVGANFFNAAKLTSSKAKGPDAQEQYVV